jgi:hypothetical protein
MTAIVAEPRGKARLKRGYGHSSDRATRKPMRVLGSEGRRDSLDAERR